MIIFRLFDCTLYVLYVAYSLLTERKILVRQIKEGNGMKQKSLAFAWLVFLSLAEVTNAQDIDKNILQEMEKRHLPGASVALLGNGKIIFAKGYGLSDIEKSIPSGFAGSENKEL